MRFKFYFSNLKTVNFRGFTVFFYFPLINITNCDERVQHFEKFRLAINL